MSKSPNIGNIVNAYGYRLSEQQLAEEQFDPNFLASRAVRVSAELPLVTSNQAASGDTTATPVTASQFEDAILCINVTGFPGTANVQFTLETYSPTLNAWFPIPNVSIPNITAAGQYAYYVQIIGSQVALKWNNGFNGGAVLLATS